MTINKKHITHVLTVVLVLLFATTVFVGCIFPKRGFSYHVGNSGDSSGVNLGLQISSDKKSLIEII